MMCVSQSTSLGKTGVQLTGGKSVADALSIHSASWAFARRWYNREGRLDDRKDT